MRLVDVKILGMCPQDCWDRSDLYGGPMEKQHYRARVLISQWPLLQIRTPKLKQEMVRLAQGRLLHRLY